ncbi:MAG: RluA family pseudouridine synthase [Deltaproteobacteria bacterium]|nr:RluA family pseudouridine synthase [Deltaproteobacteria bacterium]
MLQVLFRDEALLAVQKPPGRIVIPGRGAPEPTLLDDAQAEHGKLWVVHRLDRGTSGVLLFARTAAAHRAVNLAFDRQEVHKRYLALVRGPLPDALRVEAPLVPGRKGRVRVAGPGDPRARQAATRLRVLERFARAEVTALVEAEPETGRTHQIRVHLAHAGAPLAVDPDYGPRSPLRDQAGAVLLERTPLHAAALSLRHPVGGAALAIEAPLPEDLLRVLSWARG